MLGKLDMKTVILCFLFFHALVLSLFHSLSLILSLFSTLSLFSAKWWSFGCQAICSDSHLLLPPDFHYLLFYFFLCLLFSFKRTARNTATPSGYVVCVLGSCSLTGRLCTCEVWRVCVYPTWRYGWTQHRSFRPVRKAEQDLTYNL